jgi:hypothetical protein
MRYLNAHSCQSPEKHTGFDGCHYWTN